MIARASKPVLAAAILIPLILTCETALAQMAVLSGTVTASSGSAVPGATISVTNRDTGASISTQTDTSGPIN
jgi:hypothetical protein